MIIPHDVQIERALVAALVHQPPLLADPAVAELEVEDIHEWLAKATLAAVRNLEACGETIDMDAVIARLAHEHGKESQAVTGAETWLDAVRRMRNGESMPVQLVRGWVAATRRHRAARRAQVDAVEAIEDKVTEVALRDVERPDAARFRRAPELVKVILDRVGEGFVPHTVGEHELYRLRSGGIAVLTGAPGSGKTSLSIGLAIDHARHRGPVVYCSLEMDADELGARGIGMRCDASWEDVLCGRVRRELMDDALDLPRLVVLDDDHATVLEVERAVQQVREQYRDEPVMVVVDYLQILPGDERDVRTRVAANVQRIRRLAKRLHVVALVISQPSRAAGKALSSGELVGADSMTAMAESAEIERAAYVTIAVGSHVERDDGTRACDVSIGKSRMGGGDRVVPMTFDGRTGRWQIAGTSRAAADVRAERRAQHDDRKVATVALAIAGVLAASDTPLSRRELRVRVGANDTVARAACTLLLRDSTSGVVEVGPKERGHWRLWTRDRATSAGRPIVPSALSASSASECIPYASADAVVSASRPLVGADADALNGTKSGIGEAGCTGTDPWDEADINRAKQEASTS